MEQNTDNIPSAEPEVAQSGKNRMVRWLKRIGVGGFIFFTVKGLIWLAVFYGGFRFIGCSEG